MKRFTQHLDVLFASLFGPSITLAQMNEWLRALILIGTLVYVWRRALQKPNKNDGPEP